MYDLSFSEFDDEPRALPIDVARNRIEPLFPNLKFTSAGGSVPFQAEGYYMGIADFYFRFRHDSASLTIGRPGRHTPENDFVIYKDDVTGEDYAGTLDDDEFVALFTELMERMLAEKPLPR
jgi:hypothetical protein